jgi:osmotically inducible lipoprotein OsmB
VSGYCACTLLAARETRVALQRGQRAIQHAKWYRLHIARERARALRYGYGGTYISLNHRSNTMKIKAWIAVAALALGSAGCATYDGMSSAEKGALIGAGVGAVGGAALSNGGVLGTAAGAAAGGVIGNEVGKRR